MIELHDLGVEVGVGITIDPAVAGHVRSLLALVEHCSIGNERQVIRDSRAAISTE